MSNNNLNILQNIFFSSNEELVNLMPMLIKIVELDFSWPSFNSGLYWVALGLDSITVAGTVNDFHIIPHHDSVRGNY